MRRIAYVETRLATVAVDDLRPSERAVCFESAVVLIAALHVLGVVRSNRKTLELDSRKSLVQIEELCRYGR